jgi:hypothetical protein
VAKRETPVILSPAADSAAEDWIWIDKGGVAQLYTEGLVTSETAAHWGNDGAIEIEYSPQGVKSGLCMGLASAAHRGARVTLQTCGMNSKTIWVVDQQDANHRSVPLIPGSNNRLTAPFTLTGSATGETLTTEEMAGSSTVIDTDQMWQIIYGPLS